jgi:hypothetical protein
MHWLARILQGLLGLEQEKTKRWFELMGAMNYGYLYLTHDPITYFVPIMDRVNCIAMVRDPRDMVVSAAYYFAGLARNDWRGVRAFWKTEVPEGASFQEALAILKQTGHNDRWFSTYFKTSMPHFIVHYEDLHQRPEEVMRHLLRDLGYGDPYRCRMTEALEKASFEYVSGGRQRGEGDPNHFYRKGIVGDWRNYFTPKENQEFKARLRETFQVFGY